MSDNTPQNAPDVPPAPPAPPAAAPGPDFSTPDAPPSPTGYPTPSQGSSYQAPDTSYPAPTGQPSYPTYPSATPASPYAYSQQQQQPYAYGAQAYPYPAGQKTNALAITSLISSIAAFVILPLIASIVAVITGHMALRQLRTSGENGRGMALAGTIIGYVGVGLGVIGVILVIIWFVAIFGAVGYSAYTYSS